MEPESSLLCLAVEATGLPPQPDEMNPHSSILRSILLLSDIFQAILFLFSTNTFHVMLFLLSNEHNCLFIG